jgi:hypothetical protein
MVNLLGDLLEPAKPTDTLDYLNAPPPRALGGCADDNVGYDLVRVMNSVEEGFGGIDFGIRTIILQRHGLGRSSRRAPE